MIDNLDAECVTCHRRRGSHTLDELDVCLRAFGLDLPHEEIPDGPLRWTMDGRDVVVADHVLARSLVSFGETSLGRIRTPVLHLTFAVGQQGAPPATVDEVAVVGSPEGLRKIGKLLRDTAFSAANAAELAR